ncbi:hypothetical protein [Agrobacterium sp. SORGH_AS 787]|uniref:hypothetical protein n=1 Tax=Agrobacterium sp. SORGH_AS 787 TaxID=3041775 RepID=UPI00278262EE|nr:hypothetical protein [Rhizobium sp. SORGH_AS_0787]
MELYVLLLISAAAFGGYLLGLEGWRSASGLMGTMLAALIFAVPMGFWFLFNGLAFALKGGRGGFRANDVREVTTLLLAGVAFWICGVVVGWVQRKWRRR